MGRRILRVVSKHENGAWTHDNTTRYVYQDWNVIRETITHAQSPQETNLYFWGLDLSGRPQGAGGVGGLLAVWNAEAGHSPDEHHAQYDGNGNVMQYITIDGSSIVEFTYDAIGRTKTRSGVTSDKLLCRFSTKFECSVLDDLYFGYRYYSSRHSRWINRDPFGEAGSINSFKFNNNDSISILDYLGLAPMPCCMTLFYGHLSEEENTLNAWWNSGPDACSRASYLGCNCDGDNINPNDPSDNRGIPGILPANGLIGTYDAEVPEYPVPENGGFNPPETKFPGPINSANLPPYPTAEYLKMYSLNMLTSEKFKKDYPGWHDYLVNTSVGLLRYLDNNLSVALTHANEAARDCKCNCKEITVTMKCGDKDRDTLRVARERAKMWLNKATASSGYTPPAVVKFGQYRYSWEQWKETG